MNLGLFLNLIMVKITETGESIQGKQRVLLCAQLKMLELYSGIRTKVLTEYITHKNKKEGDKMTNYQSVVRVSERQSQFLANHGYVAMRSAGSKGAFDVIGINEQGIRFIPVQVIKARQSANR